MCGIGGIWNRTGAPPDPEALTRLMSAIAHRGPEGAARARADHDRLHLGFLRLGFTGGGTCQQPMFDPTGSVGLVFNGELYDHAALRDVLIGRGHRFETRSDTEVLLNLYVGHGERFYPHLNGEMAFALWDGKRQALLLVRDRYGIKPLFYAWHEGALVFASEIKAILALPGFVAAIDPAYFAGPGVGVAETTSTPFAGVRQVRPGHVLTVTRHDAHERPWWRPDFRTDEGTLDEHAALVREAVQRAVSRRLEGQPKIALSLSSGLDSTIVGALATAEISGTPLDAFAIGYDGASYDESAEASRTAAHYGMRFHRVRCDAASLGETFLDAVHATEVPTNSLSSAARLTLTRTVRDAGFKALLSGEGSDELFGGYPYFGIEALWRARAAGHDVACAFARFRAEEAPSQGVFWDDAEAPSELLGFPSAYALRVQRTESAMRFLFRADFLGRMGTTPTEVARTELEALPLEGLEPFDRTRLLSRSVLASLVIPSLGDRVEMAASLEGRAPYLDRDVIALAHRIPEQHCVDVAGGVRKLVLRRAFADVLPRGHRAPPKHTHMAPSFADLRATTRGAELFAALTDSAAVRDAGVFEPRAVMPLLGAHAIYPRSFPRQAMLDAMVGYVLSVQALHAVHVRDVLGRRGALSRIDLSEDRTPEPARGAA